MAKLTNLEQVRKQRSRRKAFRNLLLLALFSAVVVAIAYAVRQLDEVDLKTAVNDIKSEITTGAGFPVALPENEVRGFYVTGNALALQTPTHLYTYNDTGRQLLNLQHGMSNPAVLAAQEHIMLYDRGGNKVSLFSRAALIGSLDIKFPIHDADLSENGNLSVVSGSDRHLAQVSVYNSDFQNIFNWYSAERPIISVSISDKRDAMIVGCVDAENGSFQSEIKRFQFNVTDPMANAQLLPGELLLTLDDHGPLGARAITNERAVLFNNDLKEQAEYRFAEKQLLRFQLNKNGQTLLVLQSIEGEKQNTLVLLNADFSVRGSFRISSETGDLAFDENYVYLNKQGKIQVLYENGVLENSFVVGAIEWLRPLGDKLYYTVGGQLEMLDIKNASEESSASSKKASEAGNSSSKSASSSSSQKASDAGDTSSKNDSEDSLQKSDESQSGEPTSEMERQERLVESGEISLQEGT